MSAIDVDAISPILKKVRESKKKNPFKKTYRDKRRFSKIRSAINKNNQNSKK